MDEHLHAARLEDARYMLDHGETMERTAQRLGITVDALEKILSRHR